MGRDKERNKGRERERHNTCDTLYGKYKVRIRFRGPIIRHGLRAGNKDLDLDRDKEKNKDRDQDMDKGMNNAEDKNRTRSGTASDKDKDKGRNKESQRKERDFNQDSSIFHNSMSKRHSYSIFKI